MGSPKVRRGLLLIPLIVCSIAVLVAAYLTVKPQLDADYIVQIVERIQVGRTRIEDIAPDLRRAEAVVGVKGGRCEADLNGPHVIYQDVVPTGDARLMGGA